MARRQQNTNSDNLCWLPADQLVHLNVHLGEHDLAREKYAHAMTRVEMVKHAAEAAVLKAEQQAAKAREAAAAVLAEARNEFNAATSRLEKLTADIRSRHNLTTKHAIDAQTGAITLPEG